MNIYSIELFNKYFFLVNFVKTLLAEHWYGWRNTWMDSWCFRVCKYFYFKRWNNHIQRRINEKQVKNWGKSIGFIQQENVTKSSNGPPFGTFSREKWKLTISCQKDQRVETIIFGQLDHFWAALWTKKIVLSQNRDFENGVIVKISKS